MSISVFSPSLAELQEEELRERNKYSSKPELIRNHLKDLSPLAANNNVTEQIVRLIPKKAVKTKRGFFNFLCPSCSTTSGLIVTETGGFRFKCFHPYCGYHEATGWEPGGVIGSRVQDLYRIMITRDQSDE
jgi:hypothetical protein